MNLFADRAVQPMLVGAQSEPFDDPAYLFELKLDGERAIAYLWPGGVELRNKRQMRMLPRFPELGEIHKQVRKPCILDGEYVAMRAGKPSFADVQRRSLLHDPFKIELAARKSPVSLVAFDLLWLDGRDLTQLPLAERRELLRQTVVEDARLSLTRAVEGQGEALYRLAGQNGLEGVVAKRKASRYYPGHRTKDWVKMKNLMDDDFVVCGYICKSDPIVSLVLGQYRQGALCYCGHVTLGVSGPDFQLLLRQPAQTAPPLPVPAGHGNERAVWLPPRFVCTVHFMQRLPGGTLRQPVFKGLRPDKSPEDCRWPGP